MLNLKLIFKKEKIAQILISFLKWKDKNLIQKY